MRMKIKAIVVISLAMTLMLAGFVSAAPKAGGKLVIGRPSDAISLDSNTDTTAPGAMVYSNIIEPLLRVD